MTGAAATAQAEWQNLDGQDCTDFGFYNAAGLACSNCVFDTGACTGTCGDVTRSIEVLGEERLR